MTVDNGVACIGLNTKEKVMKTIVSMLIALSLVAGIAAPASAFDGKTFWDQQGRAAY